MRTALTPGLLPLVLFVGAAFAHADDSISSPLVQPQWLARPPVGSTWLHSIDAIENVGVLANWRTVLVAYSPIGDARWHLRGCDGCEVEWPAATLGADGGAWAIRLDLGSDEHRELQALIQHIGPDGAVEFSRQAGAGAWSNPEIRLLATPRGVVALTVGRNQLFWQGVGEDGSDLGFRAYPMPDAWFYIDGVRLLRDGGVGLVAKGRVYCDVGCPPHYVTVLRIDGDGELVWRYQFPENDVAVALGSDGSAIAALPSYADEPPSLRHIDDFGQVVATMPLHGVDALALPTQISGPIGGHWLLRTDHWITQEVAFWRIDEAAGVSASIRDASYGLTLDGGDRGYLQSGFEAGATRAVLLDPISLSPQVRFVAGSSGDLSFDSGPWPWRMLADGSAYGTSLSPRQQTRLARYAIPGSPTSDLLFRNGYD